MCTVAKSRYVDYNDSKSIQFAKNIFLPHKNSLGHVMENIDSLQWYIFPTFLWLGRLILQKIRAKIYEQNYDLISYIPPMHLLLITFQLQPIWFAC